MGPHKFTRGNGSSRDTFDQRMRSMRRQVAVVQIVVVIILTGVLFGAGWLAFHPRVIGAFAGEIYAGFSDAKGARP